MGFIYKRPESDNDLEQGSVESELSALYSSLDKQQEQLEQQLDQLQQHEDQIQQLQEQQQEQQDDQQHDSQQQLIREQQQQEQLEDKIEQLQDQTQDLQGKQQGLQEQHNKVQPWWEVPIKYDPKGFWDVKLSDVGGYFMTLLILVLVATFVLGLVFRDWGSGGGETGAATVTATGAPMASPTVAGMPGT